MKTTIWKSDAVTWIDLTRPTVEELREESELYTIDYQNLSDCLEPAHLPKLERLRDFTFVILRKYDKDGKKYPSSIQDMSNKYAIFYNDKTVITIHRVQSDFPHLIKKRHIDTGEISEPCEIVTKLMLHVVNTYEEVSQTLSGEMDKIEEQVFVQSQPKITLADLYYLKNTCRLNKKLLSLSHEVIQQHYSTERDKVALQDVKDLLQRIAHSIDETHDEASNLSTTYLSIMSQRTNDVMKLLTVYTLLFMPLSFIVGVYGMNFDIPELHWKYGYPAVLILLVLVVVTIFVWFKKKKII